MIGFCLEGNKIRFNNPTAASAATLKVSARRLTPAKTVIGTQGGIEWRRAIAMRRSSEN
jgi:hypothetical protein